MAQALAPGSTRRTHPPDVFSERTHAVARWAIPAVLGLVYGFWAAANQRHGGPVTGWNLLFGWVTAIVFMLAMVGVLYLAPRLRRELHATLWGAFTGIAVGFLYAQTGDSVFTALFIGLGCAALVGVSLFYWCYTHEDAEGHHL
ncbi:hypothetical protein [Streptomyces sp. NPDC096152]|uniref:hypothetical protein n=1 Tax=Streptomyces sp. NPDC096152 TaxID=3366078 RepID=UPI0038198BF0